MISDTNHYDFSWLAAWKDPVFLVRMSFILAATILIAHYWDVYGFGLYEDDYNFIGQSITSTGLENWYRVKYHLLTFWQGRPIHISVITLVSFWGEKLGGLPLLYGIGYIIVTANAILFYALLRRLSDDDLFTVSGALAFALFPADTTHAFLTHTLGLRLSVLFLLTACHCYISRRTILSYVFILFSLLTYETPFTVFFTAPLLLKECGSERFLRLAKHCLILTLMLICITALRKFMGEQFVSNLDLLTALVRPLRQMLIGPVTSLKMFLFRPIETLITLGNELMIFYLLCFVAFFGLLSQIKINSVKNEASQGNDRQKRCSVSSVFGLIRPSAGVALLGTSMLILAYPLTFTVSADAIDGRDSRVHLAAMPGASILYGCLCSALISIGHRYGMKRLATAVVTAFFVLLVGFGLRIQRDYTNGWLYQQVFWRQVISLCPDLNEGTVILVDPESLPRCTQIKPFSWSAPMVLPQIYEFPGNWDFKPRLYWLNHGWQDHIVSDGSFRLNNHVVTYFFWWESERLVESSNVILLETENGRISRRTKPLKINGRDYALKELSSSSAEPQKKGNLYHYLIAPKVRRIARE